VRREQDPQHARRLLLFLTDKGRAAMAEAEPRVRELEKLLMSDFTEEEGEAFADYLRRARRALEAGHPVRS